jgi:hypothetical protein
MVGAMPWLSATRLVSNIRQQSTQRLWPDVGGRASRLPPTLCEPRLRERSVSSQETGTYLADSGPGRDSCGTHREQGSSTTRAVRFFPRDGDLSRRFRTRQGRFPVRTPTIVGAFQIYAYHFKIIFLTCAHFERRNDSGQIPIKGSSPPTMAARAGPGLSGPGLGIQPGGVPLP